MPPAMRHHGLPASNANLGDHVVAGLVALGVHAMLLLLILAPLAGSRGDGVPEAAGGALSVQFIHIRADGADVTQTAASTMAASMPAPDPVADEELADVVSEAHTVQEQELPATAAEHATGLDDAVPEHDAAHAKTRLADSAHGGNDGGQSSGDDLLARYHAAMRARISAMWTERTGQPLPRACRITLELAPGGALLSASVGDCALERADHNQLEAATLMAQPMPYSGFESVFVPALDLQL